MPDVELLAIFVSAVVVFFVGLTGFPSVLWTGAVIHENTPVKLAAIHAGDWLVKLRPVAVIASAWQMTDR